MNLGDNNHVICDEHCYPSFSGTKSEKENLSLYSAGSLRRKSVPWNDSAGFSKRVQRMIYHDDETFCSGEGVL